MPNAELFPRGFGYLSLGLGTVQVVAPGALSRLIGLTGGGASGAVMRAIGLRELTVGTGLLTQPARPSPWLWARVGGDAMDLSLLAVALFDRNNQRGRSLAALATVAALAGADFWSARTASVAQGDERAPGVLRLKKAITIRRSPEEVYQFWRDFRNLPRFMSHLDSVAVVDARRSHWTARGPAGRQVEWDAELIEDQPNRRLRWQSLPGASGVSNSGTVQFQPAPGARGTEVRLDMDYAPPAAELGSFVARLFGEEPAHQVQADLRKVKQILETGQVTRSSATIGGTDLLQPSAQPPRAQQMKEARS
ncbi:MAG: SRPBCC family protein [Chloroflexi bacterium]|nr:SRPBCC family protein [Chloroflexota bacterium]